MVIVQIKSHYLISLFVMQSYLEFDVVALWAFYHGLVSTYFLLTLETEYDQVGGYISRI